MTFRGEIVGDFFVDVLVEEKVLIELKVANGLSRANYAQTINYLKATGIEVGLLVNFGTPKIEYRRFTNKFNQTDINLREIFN